MAAAGIKLVEYDDEEDESDADASAVFEQAKAAAAKAAFREKFCREMYGVGYTTVKDSDDDEVRFHVFLNITTRSIENNSCN